MEKERGSDDDDEDDKEDNEEEDDDDDDEDDEFKDDVPVSQVADEDETASETKGDGRGGAGLILVDIAQFGSLFLRISTTRSTVMRTIYRLPREMEIDDSSYDNDRSSSHSAGSCCVSCMKPHISLPFETKDAILVTNLIFVLAMFVLIPMKASTIVQRTYLLFERRTKEREKI